MRLGDLSFCLAPFLVDSRPNTQEGIRAMKVLKIGHYHVIFRFEYVGVLEVDLSALDNLDEGICSNHITRDVFEMFLITKRKYVAHFPWFWFSRWVIQKFRCGMVAF